VRIVRWIGIVLVALALGVAALFSVVRFLDGPVGPIPGGPLRGALSTEDPGDWSFAGALPTLEMEVGERSVTIWFAVHEGTLYVAAAEAARKRWPAEVVADGRVRIRVAGRLYERQLVRIEDPTLGRAVGDVFRKKYAATISPEAAAARVWIFRVDPRT
jgi:hypothetical protein